MMPIILKVVFTVVALLLSIPSGRAIPLSSFYSYGFAANDTLLPPNNDDSSPSITLPAPFLFFGTNYSTVSVSLIPVHLWHAMEIKIIIILCTLMLGMRERKSYK